MDVLTYEIAFARFGAPVLLFIEANSVSGTHRARAHAVLPQHATGAYFGGDLEYFSMETPALEEMVAYLKEWSLQRVGSLLTEANIPLTCNLRPEPTTVKKIKTWRSCGNFPALDNVNRWATGTALSSLLSDARRPFPFVESLRELEVVAR